MERIEGEAFGLFCPGGADGFVGCEASQGLEPPGKVVGRDEVGEMLPELIVAVVVVSSDGRFLDGPVHPLDLAVGPGVVDFREAMFDAVLPAAHPEHVGHVSGCRAVGVTGRQAELDAIVGQDCMDLVGHGGDEGDEEGFAVTRFALSTSWTK